MSENTNDLPLYGVYLTDMYDSYMNTLYTFSDTELWEWLNKEEDFSKPVDEFNAETAANKNPNVFISPNNYSMESVVPGTNETLDLAIGYYQNEKAMYLGQLIDDGDSRVTEFIGTDQDRYALMAEIPDILETTFL